MKLLTSLNLPIQINHIKSYLAEVLSGYLSENGGTMSGNISFGDNDAYIKGVDDSETLHRFQIGKTDGASFELFHYIQDDVNNQGQFKLNAVNTDTNTTISLIGKPNGDLTWNNHPVAYAKDIEPINATIDSTCSVGGYHCMYRCGPIVCIGWNINIPANFGTTNPIISGLPAPVEQIIFSTCGPSGIICDLKILTDGTISIINNVPTAATWYNGNVCYLTQE